MKSPKPSITHPEHRAGSPDDGASSVDENDDAELSDVRVMTMMMIMMMAAAVIVIIF